MAALSAKNVVTLMIFSSVRQLFGGFGSFRFVTRVGVACYGTLSSFRQAKGVLRNDERAQLSLESHLTRILIIPTRPRGEGRRRSAHTRSPDCPNAHQGRPCRVEREVSKSGCQYAAPHREERRQPAAIPARANGGFRVTRIPNCRPRLSYFSHRSAELSGLCRESGS